MKQYIREYDGQMAYLYGHPHLTLLDGTLLINLDIASTRGKVCKTTLHNKYYFAWIWENMIQKNSEDRERASKKGVIVDEAWMLLPYPEAVRFLKYNGKTCKKKK